MATASAFLRLTRPFFLLGGALLFALGATFGDGSLTWERYALGQAMVTAIQLTAHYANEYFDLEADRLVGARRTWFSGGSGVLAAGELAPDVAHRAALATTGISMATIAAVATVDGWAAAAGAVGLAGAWGYSAPPLRLVSTWWGITSASLVVSVLVPLTGALLAGSAPSIRLGYALAPLFLLHHAMLLAFERPDRESDEQAGKTTLSVRLGPGRVGILHGVLILGAFTILLAGPAAGYFELSEARWLVSLVPLAVWQTVAFYRAGDPILAAGAVALFGLTVLALLPMSA